MTLGGFLNSGHQIHLMGIGGSGMSSLAQVLLQMGEKGDGLRSAYEQKPSGS